jgi:hypothetical protein
MGAGTSTQLGRRKWEDNPEHAELINGALLDSTGRLSRVGDRCTADEESVGKFDLMLAWRVRNSDVEEPKRLPGTPRLAAGLGSLHVQELETIHEDRRGLNTHQAKLEQ